MSENELPELETVCRKCGGQGRGGVGVTEACGLCDGSGYELTEFGEKVLSLVRRRFRGLFDELVRGR
jgi:RecJ-like exonuclease